MSWDDPLNKAEVTTGSYVRFSSVRGWDRLSHSYFTDAEVRRAQGLSFPAMQMESYASLAASLCYCLSLLLLLWSSFTTGMTPPHALAGVLCFVHAVRAKTNSITWLSQTKHLTDCPRGHLCPLIVLYEANLAPVSEMHERSLPMIMSLL